MARRLVAAGDTVEWFAGAFPGSVPEEEIEGIHIVRSGRQWTVHWRAWRRYRRRIRRDFDVVIDEVNTMPFFTPLWAGIRVFMLIFQLAREVWWYESRPPLSAIGFALEPLYLRVYRRTPALTISASTERDLRRLGLRAPIAVVPIGTEPITPPASAARRGASFLYVGRLAPSKRVHHILEALARFRADTGEGSLRLVGEGSPAYVERLRRLVRRLDLDGVVEFCGRLPPEAKHRVMGESFVLLMASAREGWGLVVTEAAACGTPAVVYDVGGLRDSVRDAETGLVVPPHPEALAAGMARLWRDPELYKRLAAEAQRWSRTFSYDRAAALVRARIA